MGILKEIKQLGTIPEKPLGEIGNIYSGLSGKSKKDFNSQGNSLYITYKNVYLNPSVNLNINDKVNISKEEKQRTIEYLDVLFTGSSETRDECAFSSVVTEEPKEKYYLNSFCFLWRPNDKKKFIAGFLKHLFRSSKMREKLNRTAEGTIRFNVSKKRMLSIPIPIPPITTQKKITEILDRFTQLIESKKAGLTNEIELRKKQYEYYREWLFKKYCAGVPEKPLGEICEIKRGKVISKDYINKHPGVYPVYSSQTVNNGELGKIDSYMYDGEFVTWTTDGVYAGSVFYRKGKFNITNISGLLELKKSSDCVYKYLYFVLKKIMPNYVNDINSNKKMMSNVVKTIPIPIPPITTQKKITEILDRFTQLIESKKAGLTNEIELRKKQYEYYRDQLLNFSQEKC